MKSNLEEIQHGKVISGLDEIAVESLPWHDHPAFPGVMLQHLISSKDTDGKFSCHVVRINTGCEIGTHIHAGKWELHEVVKGRGHCIIDTRKIDYGKGVINVIPADIPHSVFADDEIYLLAKFVPALL